MNTTFLPLIPKKRRGGGGGGGRAGVAAEELKNLRPISLVGGLYK